MSFSGPLFRFALFQTRSNEFHLFSCCHHIILDGTGVALMGRRIASSLRKRLSTNGFETTSLLLGEVPAAFHAGVRDVLVVAFGLAINEFPGAGAPFGIDVEGHGCAGCPSRCSGPT